MADDIDKRTDEFTHEWDENIDKLSQIPRWDVDMLGPAMVDYRDKMQIHEQRRFADRDLPDFLTKAVEKGKNPQEFRAEAGNKTLHDAGLAVEFDVAKFYKEVEAAISTHPKDPNNNSRWERIKDAIFKKGIPKFIEKLGDAKAFKKRLNDLMETRASINEINAIIYMQRKVLSLREKQLIENAEGNMDADRDAAIREDILSRQQDIKGQVTERLDALDKEGGVIENLKGFNELWAAVDRELKQENREIKKKFGAKVRGLFVQRQALVLELSKLGTQRVEDMQRQFQVKEDVHKIEVELEEIQKELIKYKAENPVFLFEKYLGHQSIDSIKGFGPPSDEFVANAWAKARREKDHEDGGMVPPIQTMESDPESRNK